MLSWGKMDGKDKVLPPCGRTTNRWKKPLDLSTTSEQESPWGCSQFLIELGLRGVTNPELQPVGGALDPPPELIAAGVWFVHFFLAKYWVILARCLLLPAYLVFAVLVCYLGIAASPGRVTIWRWWRTWRFQWLRLQWRWGCFQKQCL